MQPSDDLLSHALSMEILLKHHGQEEESHTQEEESHTQEEESDTQEEEMQAL